jgi:hypothetical protein
MKNLPDILLRLFVAAALVVGGITILRTGSAGSIVTCTPQQKTVSCTITERFASSQQIMQEKTIDKIARAKVATINAPQEDGNDVQFFRVLGTTAKGVSYQIAQDEKNQDQAEAIASQLNFLIEHPNSAPIQLDYSSKVMNYLGWGAIGLGAIVSVVPTKG